MTSTQSFIDGRSVPSAQTYDNIDPSTGQSLGAWVGNGFGGFGVAASVG